MVQLGGLRVCQGWRRCRRDKIDSSRAIEGKGVSWLVLVYRNGRCLIVAPSLMSRARNLQYSKSHSKGYSAIVNIAGLDTKVVPFCIVHID